MQTCVALQQALADADAVCGWGSASDDLRISDVLDTDIDLLTIDFSDTFDVPACPGTEVALVNATTAMEEPRTTPQPHAPPPQTTPATAQPDESASALVELACSDHEKSAQELDVLFEQQQQILTRAASELQRGVPIGLLAQAPELQQLREVHMQLSQRLQAAVTAVQYLLDNFLLSSQEIGKCRQMQGWNEFQTRTLDLLATEGTAWSESLAGPHAAATAPPLATAGLFALVVVEQPFPLVLMKGNQLQADTLKVRLVAATGAAWDRLGEAAAAIVTRDGVVSSAGLHRATAPVDARLRTANFPLKFVAGTNKTSVEVHFGLQVQARGAPATTTIASERTRPFAVMTNECQFEYVLGNMLKREIWDDTPRGGSGSILGVPVAAGSTPVKWARAANLLQEYFARNLRQALLHPTRSLDRYDLDYLHRRHFEGHALVTREQFERFWEWFGRCMHTLRYSRHVLSMWQHGLVYGFMARETVESVLVGQHPGTFLIRFSERAQFAGQFAIDYIKQKEDQEAQICHYLIQKTDVHAKQTLPRFLARCKCFINLLVFVTNANGSVQFQLLPKEEALSSYCTPVRDDPKNAFGYEHSLN